MNLERHSWVSGGCSAMIGERSAPFTLFALVPKLITDVEPE